MTALLFRQHEVEELGTWDGDLGDLGDDSLLWIDLEHPDDDAIAELAETLGLEQESVRRLGDADPHPWLGDFGEYLHVSAYAPRSADQSLERVVCLVSGCWIVTVRAGAVEVVDELRERAEGAGGLGKLEGLDVLADLLTWVLEGYLRAFEEIDVALEELDGRVMANGAARDSLRVLVGLRAQIGGLRRALVSHRPVLLALTRPELGGISTTESAERFESLLDRLGDVTQAARDSRESVVGSFDVLMTQVGQRTNDIMKTLTLVSLLLLPGTLLAGVLGMNFKVGLFDHPDLFWAALVAIVGIAAVVLVLGRVRRWI